MTGRGNGWRSLNNSDMRSTSTPDAAGSAQTPSTEGVRVGNGRDVWRIKVFCSTVLPSSCSVENPQGSFP